MRWLDVFVLVLQMSPPISCGIMQQRGSPEVKVLLGITGSGVRGHSSCDDDDDVSMNAVEISQTFSYVINDVNNASQILQGAPLGLAVFDTCRDETVAILLADIIAQEIGNEAAEREGSPSGVVMYPSHLEDSEEVKSELTRHKILNVELDFWPFGARESPDNRVEGGPSYHFALTSPHALLGRAMRDFLVHHKWTYVSLVVSDSATDMMVTEAVTQDLANAGICIATLQTIPSDTTNPVVYSKVAGRLVSNNRARAVLVLVKEKHLQGLAKAFDSFRSFKNYFVWLTYGPNGQALSNNGAVIQFTTDAWTDEGEFLDYYGSLTVETNLNNPWFRKVLDAYNDCPPLSAMLGMDCEPLDHPSRLESRPLDLYFQTVNMAIRGYRAAVESALVKARNRSCSGEDFNSSTCLERLNGTDLLSKLAEEYRRSQNVQIRQLFPNDSVMDIGDWNSRLSLSKDPGWEVLQSLTDDSLTYAPDSTCSKECPPGFVPIYGPDRCCWVCVKNKPMAMQ